MAEPRNQQEELLQDIFGSESELSDPEDDVPRAPPTPAAAPHARRRTPPTASPSLSRSASPDRDRGRAGDRDEYRDDGAVRKLPKIKKKVRREGDERERERGGERRERPVKRRRRERRAVSPGTAAAVRAEILAPVELSPDAQRRADIDKKIDAIIKPNKGMRGRKRKADGDGDDTFLDDEVIDLKEQMLAANLQDEVALMERRPAMEKLKLLPRVMDVLQKQSLQTAILENGLLQAVYEWLEPNKSDKSLPALNIQNALFGALQKMTDIDTTALKECHLGQVVLFYTKCPAVQEHIKRIAAELVDRWSRPIIRHSVDYRTLNIPLAPSDSAGQSGPTGLSLHKILAGAKAGAADRQSRRVRIPDRVQGVYTVAPRSNVVLDGRAGDAADEARERRRRETQRLNTLKRKLVAHKKGAAAV